jgi:hypothetical protein
MTDCSEHEYGVGRVNAVNARRACFGYIQESVMDKPALEVQADQGTAS